MANYYVIREQIEMTRWRFNSKATIPLLLLLLLKKKNSLAIKNGTSQRANY
jgi:hypothetical protein